MINQFVCNSFDITLNGSLIGTLIRTLTGAGKIGSSNRRDQDRTRRHPLDLHIYKQPNLGL
jgi:hypothetical protein